MLGQLPLLLAADEDAGAVGVAAITELAARVERIDIAPEHVQEFLVCHLGRIIGDLDRLGVARAPGGDLLVGRIDGGAAGIAGGGVDHPVQLVKGRLHAPKAAAGEDRDRAARGGRIAVGSGPC